VQYPYLANLLKLTYVDVATREFPLEDRPQSDSRISRLTGIHRQDVKRLRGGDDERHVTPAADFAGCAPGFALAGETVYPDSKGRPKGEAVKHRRGPGKGRRDSRGAEELEAGMTMRRSSTAENPDLRGSLKSQRR